jgi:3-isopropylmalate dehydratase small subunit
MKILINGRRWILGDNIDTDILFPGRFMTVQGATAEGALRGLAAVHPRMATDFASGDAIVAGSNFGCGSSREYAATALRDLGVPIVIAASFARIFYRNAYTIGLPLLEYHGAQLVPPAGPLEIDLAAGTIIDGGGHVLQAVPVAPALLGLLADGGLMPRLRRQISRGQIATGRSAGGRPAVPRETDFPVLHALSVKGTIQGALAAATVGRAEPQARQALDRLVANGFARFWEQRDCWQINADGRVEHARLLAADIPGDAAQRLRPLYEEFLPANAVVKALATRWQVRDGVPNDHTDAAHDGAVLAALEEVHGSATGLLVRMAAVRVRYGRYATRLGAALERLCSGDQSAFTGVFRDSYHEIWMEIHADLLLSLGIPRDAEEHRSSSGWAVG